MEAILTGFCVAAAFVYFAMRIRKILRGHRCCNASTCQGCGQNSSLQRLAADKSSTARCCCGRKQLH